MWEIANIATPARLPNIRTVANAISATEPSRITSGVKPVELLMVKTDLAWLADKSALSTLAAAAILVTGF